MDYLRKMQFTPDPFWISFNKKNRYLWGRLETVAISLCFSSQVTKWPRLDQVVQETLHVWQGCGCFPEMVVLQNGWFIMENPIFKWWFGGTTLYGNTHGEASMIFHFLWSLMPMDWVKVERIFFKPQCICDRHNYRSYLFFLLTGWGNCTPWILTYVDAYMDTVSKQTAIYFWRSYLFQTIIMFSIVFYIQFFKDPFEVDDPSCDGPEEKFNLTPKKRSGLRT